MEDGYRLGGHGVFSPTSFPSGVGGRVTAGVCEVDREGEGVGVENERAEPRCKERLRWQLTRN